MVSFLAGTDVALEVPIVDASGNKISVSAISYRVVDQGGAELVPNTLLSSFSAGSESAVVLVLAATNALTILTNAEYRNVELFCTSTTNGNTFQINSGYIIEPTERLIVGLNSFQTPAQAELTASSMANLVGWNNANQRERISALLDARSHIVQLSFTQLNSNANWGQDSLNFVPEGTYPTNYVSNGSMFLFNGNLSMITPTQFVKLPEKFQLALRQAQIAEADSILGGDGVEKLRREGLTLESIGDVKQMFRPGKPLDLPVCRRALGYLSYFVTFSKRIGRS